MNPERVMLLRELISEAVAAGVLIEFCVTHDGVWDEMLDDDDMLDKCVHSIRWVNTQ